MKKRYVILIILIVSAFALIISVFAGTMIFLSGAQSEKGRPADFSSMLSGDSTPGFKKALEVRSFIFPEDSGPHPGYQTEWWYYTGNLEDSSGRSFGYQLTFFRRALNPDNVNRESAWAANQIYFAHFTVSDIENKKFYTAQRWSRAALKLAGAKADPHKVWIGNWSSGKDGNVFILIASENDFSINLMLEPVKPVVLQGDRGLSQKGGDPGNASYYYSITRLKTEGSLKVDGTEFQVQGLSWLDREWSTSALGEDLKGWDWFSLQLDDGRDIMLYQLRGKDGSIDTHSAGALIDKDGSIINLESSEFDIKVLDSWESPDTGVLYPSKWHVSIPEYAVDLTVTPYQPNQELNLSFIYWEGAVSISGGGLSGNGYVELTGYEGSR
jgi:predicted secreted hydrolase